MGLIDAVVLAVVGGHVLDAGHAVDLGLAAKEQVAYRVPALCVFASASGLLLVPLRAVLDVNRGL